MPPLPAVEPRSRSAPAAALAGVAALALACIAALAFARALSAADASAGTGPRRAAAPARSAAAPVRGAAAPAPVLRRVLDIPLPGPAVRFDYQSLDTTSNRLYISHMDAGEMLVFDVAQRRVSRRVGGLPRVTGVLAVPALGKVYASATGRDDVAVIDARSDRVIARLGRIGFPDGIAYAPSAKKIYVSDETGGGELVIDGPGDRVMTRIPLGGEAGNTIYDPGSGHILVAVQTRNQIVEIDPATDRVVARHALPGASHPHGLVLDTSRRLLFAANEESGTVMTVDLHTMRVLDTERVGEGPDVLAFDPGPRRLYVASESGVVSVFAEKDEGLAPLGEIRMPDAHTVAVDPRTHLVYFPLQDLRGRPVLRIMERPGGGP